jgi:hypothetical protein
MRKITKGILLSSVIIALLAGGMTMNYILTAPGTAPKGDNTCVYNPVTHQFESNLRVCDTVTYTLLKLGVTQYSLASLHLQAEHWKYINTTAQGSYFSYTTHNLLTSAGQTYLQGQIHTLAGATTTYTVTYLALSQGYGNSGTPAYADTICGGGSGLTQSETTVFNLIRTIGTYTSGTPNGAGSITAQLKATWTSTGVIPGLDEGCAIAANPTYSSSLFGTLYAENTFSSVSLNAGDQLTLTWQFTYSG